MKLDNSVMTKDRKETRIRLINELPTIISAGINKMFENEDKDIYIPDILTALDSVKQQ